MEHCYVCGLLIGNGAAVYVLVDDEGYRWFVHVACMTAMESA